MGDAYESTRLKLQEAIEELQSLPSSRANSIAITQAEQALMWHEKDTADRAKQMDGLQ
jgi:hypothetical protein